MKDSFFTSLKTFSFWDLPVFMPTLNYWRLAIDFIIFFTTLLRFYIITIKFSFFISEVNASFDLIPNSLLITLLIVYFIEIFISINTGYYHEGNVITDRKLIFAKHIKSKNFFANSVSHIPYVIYIFYNAG
jgi:hypothetical protein